MAQGPEGGEIVRQTTLFTVYSLSSGRDHLLPSPVTLAIRPENDEVAQGVPPDVDAFSVHEEIDFFYSDGSSRTIGSSSGLVYIDGTFFEIDKVPLESGIMWHGYPDAIGGVLTRNGGWLPFFEEDQIVSTKPPQRPTHPV